MDWCKYFRYETSTGKLFWAVNRGKVKAGDEAGCFSNTCGYRMVKIDGVLRLTHRVIWDLVRPEDKLTEGEEIDHIDHNKLNNRIENLRKVKHIGNMHNRSKAKNNKSGITGVLWVKKSKRWWASIFVNGVNINLGYFHTKDEAASARKNAEVAYKFHKNHGE